MDGGRVNGEEGGPSSRPQQGDGISVAGDCDCVRERGGALSPLPAFPDIIPPLPPPLPPFSCSGSSPALFALTGSDRSGAVAVLRRGLAPEVVTEVPLAGVDGVWALRHRQEGGEEEQGAQGERGGDGG